jgi:murein DD-endopeptidase MepM/ murein hydrolase activator NlpD
MTALAVLLLLAARAAEAAPPPAPEAAPPSSAAEAAPADPAARPVPSPSILLAPPAARPGDAVLIRVPGAGAAAPSGTLAGKPLLFWRSGDEWRAMAPLAIETPPGPLAIEVTPPGGTPARAALDVVPSGFPSRSLTVDDKFVEPPPKVKRRIAADRAAFASAYARPFAPPRFERGGFAWPREARLTGRYGDKRVFNEKRESIHYGTDVTGPVGSPIAAAADGEVALVRDAYMSGKTVVLFHGADVYTAYFHLDRIRVKQGAKVRRGQVIGTLGRSGRVTGPHLHWSARVGGLYVDPEALLAIDFGAGTAPPRETRVEPAAPAPAEGPDAPPAAATGGPPTDGAVWPVTPAEAAPAPGR